MPKYTIEYFHKLLELVKVERKEDLEIYKSKVQKQPISERKKNGFTWYPVTVTKMGFTYGDRAFVVIERASDPNAPKHLFRAGKSVSLFNQDPESKDRDSNGVINFVDKSRMKIVLNAQDLPIWIEGKHNIGVDLLFDDRTYEEMEKAMRQVIKAKGSRLAELRDISILKRAAANRSFDSIDLSQDALEGLNESQIKAVQQAIEMHDIALIHGPPGTGKTTTLVATIQILASREQNILVCSPSNTATDVLTERLASKGLTVVRIGNLSRVDESLVQHTLDAQMANHPENKHIKRVRKQAAEIRRKAQRYRRSFGYEEKQERKSLYQEAKELSSWANQLEDRLIDQILSSANVLTCTLVGASQKVLNNYSFKTVVIDEAAQALEPATWIPILKASKVILAGDPYQLPPTVKSMEATKAGFETTLLERCLESFPVSAMLEVQYRMHKTIMGFSNQKFYKENLLADATVANWVSPFGDPTPLVFIDTAGCGFEEEMHPMYLSKFNTGEYNILREHLLKWKNSIPQDFPKEDLPNIAIISPYREQTILISTSLNQDEDLKELPYTVDTVDGFQGQERSIVYISLVRSNPKGEIGFLKDYRRMNVAMTRAQKKLIIIGDTATLGQDPFYSDLIDYCDQHGSYQSAWSYMQNQ